MAFTFQINNDIQFIHNEKFLTKAEENRPAIQTETIVPNRLVDVVDDVTKLNNIGVVTS